MKKIFFILSLLMLSGCVIGGSFGMGNGGAGVGISSGITF